MVAIHVPAGVRIATTAPGALTSPKAPAAATFSASVVAASRPSSTRLSPPSSSEVVVTIAPPPHAPVLCRSSAGSSPEMPPYVPAHARQTDRHPRAALHDPGVSQRVDGVGVVAQLVQDAVGVLAELWCSSADRRRTRRQHGGKGGERRRRRRGRVL